MRRIVVLLSVVAVMAAMMLVMAAPAFADRGGVPSNCSTADPLGINAAGRLCGNPHNGIVGEAGAPPAPNCNSKQFVPCRG